MYFVFFLIFFNKKISDDSILLTQKERCPKRYLNLFFDGHFFRGLSQWRLQQGCRRLSFVLDLSEQMCTFVLHGLAWVVRLMGCCMIFQCMIICCLLKSFSNCHSVCHPNNNIYTPFQQFCSGSNHGSPVFISFKYPVVNSPTHSLSHWIISC